ncbi:MAG: T9SS type A sorting domain-containing protein [Candidatus Cloacimonetes bacterium]|nr:T9SS type A sorting domain-containing protein [Candidatus Cloacimonadota bacterium]
MLVEGNITVNNGVILSIDPGVRVVFTDFYHLLILGTLLAEGTSDNMIRFTSAWPEMFYPDDSTNGCWNGIRFINTLATNIPSRLTYCLIEYSKGLDEFQIGGALSLYNFSELEITNCLLRSNYALYGGAIGCEYHSSPVITGNLLTGNYASVSGSPLYCSYSYPKIINNTIADNHVLNTDPYIENGSIVNFISKPWIGGNIIWSNFNNYFLPVQIWEGKGFYTSFNDIEGGFIGTGNMAEDPLFNLAEPHPFSLNQDSPCLDTIDWPDVVYPLPENDLAGNPRWLDGNEDGWVMLDMGAYEFNPDQNPVSDDDVLLPSAKLLQNFPNPFNPFTEIRFLVSQQQEMQLSIYNLKGQLIRFYRISSSDIVPGQENLRSIFWNGTDSNGYNVPSGIYFYRIESGKWASVSRKMLLIK